METENNKLVGTLNNEIEETRHFFLTLSDNSVDLNQLKGKNKDFRLIPAGMSIKEALDRSPFKSDFFKPKSLESEKKSSQFNDEFLAALEEYSEDLKPKEHTFLTDGIETKKDISQLGISDRQLKKMNKKEREKTKGSNWFNMKAPELTEELKNDLQVLEMRSALDPKHFYKRSERKTLPKYFEIGHVVDSAVEYHNSKNIRKRNKTLVDELMEDAEFQKYNKKKYIEGAMSEKQKTNYFKKPKKATKK